jgi:hypothetical protein
MSTQQLSVKPAADITVTAAVSRFSVAQIGEANISTQAVLPKLEAKNKGFIPVSVEYWSPATEGEEKLVYIAGVSYHDVPNMDTGEISSVECVMMLEQQEDKLCRYISASKVLVGNIKDAISRGDIVPMTTLTPVAIAFIGKKKNRGNGKMSNRWQIIPLIVTEQ